jgi:hypothetical protein
MPTYEKSKRHYIAMYLGFDNGLAYFQPCSIPKRIWNDPKINDYSDCGVEDPVSGWDARCRPWYQDASKPENRDYALVNEPYYADDSPFVYVTVS